MVVRIARLGRQMVMQDDEGERLVSPESIIRAAAQRCGVSYEEVMGRSRVREIVEARHEAIMALAALGYRPQQIAKHMRLQHTSVLFHLNRLARKRYGGRP